MNDWVKEKFDKLKGKYKHYCPDWDYLAIDETCPEFECCTCRKEHMEEEKTDGGKKEKTEKLS